MVFQVVAKWLFKGEIKNVTFGQIIVPICSLVQSMLFAESQSQ